MAKKIETLEELKAWRSFESVQCDNWLEIEKEWLTDSLKDVNKRINKENKERYVTKTKTWNPPESETNFDFLFDAMREDHDLFQTHEYFPPANRHEWHKLLKEYEVYLKQQTILENVLQDDNKVKVTAKHHALAYILDCHAKGESLPIGQKKKLEQIGNKRIGNGKGNAFYKEFGKMVRLDLNSETILIDFAGENWRNVVLELSENPEIVEDYLKSKQL